MKEQGKRVCVYGKERETDVLSVHLFVCMSGEEKERVECISVAGLDHLARCSISETV